MCEEGTGVATTNSCDHLSESARDFCARNAGDRAAIDHEGQPCAAASNTARAEGDTGKAHNSGTRDACCICTCETRRPCSGQAGSVVDANEASAFKRCNEARDDYDYANQARNAGARGCVESNIGSDSAQGSAQVDESDRPHDEADAEEPGGRFAGRIP
jgi:hypothetical protein